LARNHIGTLLQGKANEVKVTTDDPDDDFTRSISELAVCSLTSVASSFTFPPLLSSYRCEYSPNNHFMYYIPVSKKRRKMGKVPEGWEAPTKAMRMPYREWLQHANVTDDQLGPDKPHWYYRLIGCGLMGNDGSCDKGSSEYLYDELPFFQPKPSLYIVEPNEQKGIHCRFGMKGVIAENHFDGSRNSIVVLGGARRYILAHPEQCSNLALYPKGHPSARHSAVDWSDPNLEEFPQFADAKANEVVLQPGQVSIVYRFHFEVVLCMYRNLHRAACFCFRFSVR